VFGHSAITPFLGGIWFVYHDVVYMWVKVVSFFESDFLLWKWFPSLKVISFFENDFFPWKWFLSLKAISFLEGDFLLLFLSLRKGTRIVYFFSFMSFSLFFLSLCLIFFFLFFFLSYSLSSLFFFLRVFLFSCFHFFLACFFLCAFFSFSVSSSSLSSLSFFPCVFFPYFLSLCLHFFLCVFLSFFLSFILRVFFLRGFIFFFIFSLCLLVLSHAHAHVSLLSTNIGARLKSRWTKRSSLNCHTEMESQLTRWKHCNTLHHTTTHCNTLQHSNGRDWRKMAGKCKCAHEDVYVCWLNSSLLVRRDAFMYATWLIYMPVRRRRCVCVLTEFLCISVSWCIHVCDVTHSCVQRDSFICKCARESVCVYCLNSSVLVRVDAFMCVTWLMHICNLTYSCVQRDSFICKCARAGVCVCLLNSFLLLSRESFMCATWRDSHMWHDSIICWTNLFKHLTKLTYSYVTCLIHTSGHDTFVFVTWLVHMWYDVFLQVTWLIRICDIARSYVTWLMYTCDMTHS